MSSKNDNKKHTREHFAGPIIMSAGRFKIDTVDLLLLLTFVPVIWGLAAGKISFEFGIVALLLAGGAEGVRLLFRFR